MSKKPIVEVKNLKISSNNNYLIRDLSFKVMPNEILGIIGESGSGKSLTAPVSYTHLTLPTNC